MARELGIPAYVGMRNWHPFIADTLQQMTADGVEQAVAICLAPHNSRTSVGLYKQVLFGRRRSVRHRFRRGVARSSAADRSIRREAARRLEEGLREARLAAAGDLHGAQRAHSAPSPKAIRTRRRRARRRRWLRRRFRRSANGSFAFQSQGMSGGEWLGPTVEDTIVGAAGSRATAASSCSRSASSAITWRFCSTSIFCSGSSRRAARHEAVSRRVAE